MIAEAHELGIRVLLDIVPNHLSDQHAWFQAALAAGPGLARARPLHLPRRPGADGEQPPNDWRSGFGGPAWTRVPRPTAPRASGTCTCSPRAARPRLDQRRGAEEFDETMRFWFDRGVDGFRVDVAHGLAKAEGLPDIGPPSGRRQLRSAVDHPHWDRDDVHEIYRRWRELADTYDDPRVFVAEAWVTTPSASRGTSATTSCTGLQLRLPDGDWDARPCATHRRVAGGPRTPVGAPPTWVLTNHVSVRQASRYARPQAVRELGHSTTRGAAGRVDGRA